MEADLINIGLAFIEGLALIISPCILPILPIILSGSLTGSRVRPFGIITGFIITFAFVTLFSRSFIMFTHVSEDSIRNISFGILLILGLIMMSTYLTEKFALFTNRLTNIGGSLKIANNPESGFLGGLIFGGLVGIIWTPCAGPILAAVIVQVVLQHTTLTSMLAVLAFGVGAGLPMLLIALLGRRLINHFTFIRNKANTFRKLLGLIIVLTSLYLIYSNNLTFSFGASTNTQSQESDLTLINGLEKPYQAPEISGIDAWINSPPLTLKDLQGKVVLIDFWTYSCINCVRTLSYLKDWYAKYHDQGFEIIGVHSPEFEFEHNLNNVKNAVAKFEIHYPVALDNQFVTWRNFNNEYWPAHYLINKEGKVVYEHFGEGEYDVTENNIRYLLGKKMPAQAKEVEQNYSTSQTPETYLGYERAERFSSDSAVVRDKAANYVYPEEVTQNNWALQGRWIIYPDKIVSQSSGASIKLHYDAKKVYAVMGIKNKPVMVKVWVNGQPIAGETGSDVKAGLVEVKENRLFSLINAKKEEEGVIELVATSPGLELYTFTFGD